jgi:hypothetical protein
MSIIILLIPIKFYLTIMSHEPKYFSVFHKIQNLKISLLSNFYTVTNLINALPGDSSVNTVQHAAIDKLCFLCPLYAQCC